MAICPIGRNHLSKTSRLLFMICLTLFFFLIEIVSGFLTRSVALVADSAHMLSDSGALIIALFSVRISKRKSNRNTFGWVRAEILGALVNAVFLLALCVSIATQALKRFVHFEEIEDNIWLIIVGVIGLTINLIGLCILQGDGHAHHHHHHAGHEHLSDCNAKCSGVDNETFGSSINDVVPPSNPIESSKLLSEHNNLLHAFSNCSSDSEVVPSHGSTTRCNPFTPVPQLQKGGTVGRPCNHSFSSHFDKLFHAEDTSKCAKRISDEKHSHSASQMNMKGVILHVFNDALGSVVVIISGLCIRYIPDQYKWKHYFDPIMSLVMVSMIVGFTVPLLKESVMILLQTVPTHINVEELRSRLLDRVKEVVRVRELHVWQLCGMKIIASAHVQCHTLSDYMRVAEDIKCFFHEEGIHSTTVQPEFVEGEFTRVV